MSSSNVAKDFYEEFEIDLSTLCNLKCPLCIRNYEHGKHLFDGPRTGRPLQEIISQLDSFPNFKMASVAGMCSEPTMYKDFMEFIKYLNSRNIQLDLHTSGDVRGNKFWVELAGILKENDTITFTVCGSTQTMHEMYRIGSVLNRVLEVAKLVEDNCEYKTAVQMQILHFEYNKDDLDNIKLMLNQFNNVYVIISEGFKTMNLTDFITPPTKNMTPPISKLRAMKALYNSRVNKDGIINCAFHSMKKITFNNDGSVSACHIQSEFNIPFNYDYDKIFNYEYGCCLICEKQTQNMLSILDLDSVN